MDYVKYVGVGIITILIAYLSLCALSPNRVLVSQTMIINRPASDIYPELVTLGNWHKWHPYFSQLTQDQINVEATDTVVGSTLIWNSDEKNGGKIILIQTKKNKSLKTNVTYKKDNYGQVNQTEFILEEKGNSTKVIWLFVGHEYSFFKSPGTLLLKQVFAESMSDGLKSLKSRCEKLPRHSSTKVL